MHLYNSKNRLISLILLLVFSTLCCGLPGLADGAANDVPLPTVRATPGVQYTDPTPSPAAPVATPVATHVPTVQPETEPVLPTVRPTVEPTQAPTVIPTPEPTATPEPEPTMQPLTIDSRGDEVRLAQELLRQYGFMSGKADGIYGPQTADAVKRFQRFVYEIMGKELYYSPSATVVPDPIGIPTRLPLELLQGIPTPPVGDPYATAQPIGYIINQINTSTAAPTVIATAEPTPAPTPYAPDGVLDEAGYKLLTQTFKVYFGQLTKGDDGHDVTRLQTRLAMLYYLNDVVDGDYGSRTQTAVSDFQRYNGLSQTGIADEATQRRLYSAYAVPTAKPTPVPTPEPGPTDDPNKPNHKKYEKYKLVIDVSEQRVYVYGYENGEFRQLVEKFVCSTGVKDHPTPLGTFKGSGPDDNRWHWFEKYKCWAQYAWRIEGNILFHSVLYDKNDESTLRKGSLNALGSRASHGCIRLAVEDAKWIFDNCKRGTTVVVQE